MTKRERVTAVLQHKPVDRLPVQVNYTGAMGGKLSSFFHCEERMLAKRFDNHLFRLDFQSGKRQDSQKNIEYDVWGVGFDTAEEGYRIKEHPLIDKDKFTGYQWPDPGNRELFKGIAHLIKGERDSTDRMILPNFGFLLFERAWSLVGFEEFLMDLYGEPLFCENLLETITEIQIGFARRWKLIGVDGGYFGDDLGAQQGLLFSPELWRKMFKPRLKRIFDVFTGAGLPVIMHSDGDIKEILPDLVDIGLTCLNPCQPEVLDHKWLKKEFGKDLCFYGGLSTQETLPMGTGDEVIEAGKRCIRDLASDGTGLIFGPSHRIMSDIPEKNVEALLSLYDFL